MSSDLSESDNLTLLTAIYYKQLRLPVKPESRNGTTQLTDDGPAATKQDLTATKPAAPKVTNPAAPKLANHDPPIIIQDPQLQKSRRSTGESSSRQQISNKAPATSHRSSPGMAHKTPITSLNSPALNSSKSRVRNNSERIVRIQEDHEPPQPGRSGVNTLGLELGYMGREPSNSSIYSDLTSIEGMISPNPRAGAGGGGGGRFAYEALPTSGGNADPTARRDNCHYPHNTIAASKLVHELSPMIKRKVISAMQSVQNAGNTVQQSAKSNRHLAFLAIFVCPPLGCLAWHHASKVRQYVKDNDFISARVSSKMAATYSYIGFLIGGLLMTGIFVFFVCVEEL